MQFRAGILYVVLFVVIAAGAYGVIATAESPEVTIDDAEADHVLEVGDEFDVDDQVFNVTELSADSGTVEHVEEDATLDAEWDDGDTVLIEEDLEYIVEINQPEDADDEADDEGDDAENGEDENDADEADDDDADEADEEEDEEAGPESFTLRENYDEDEYETLEGDDGTYIVTDEGEHVHIDDFDEIDSQTYEVGDSIEFYEEELEEMVDGEVADITEETVTVEYVGELVTEYDLEHTEIVTLNDQDFGVYFPSDEQVYLTSDIDDFESQQQEVEDFGERIHGFWWVTMLSIVASVLVAGLAFLPVRN